MCEATHSGEQGTGTGREIASPIVKLPETICRFSPDLRYQSVNPSFVFATGIPSEQIIGKTHREVGIPENICKIIETGLKRLLETGSAQTYEWEATDAFGIPRNFLSTAIPDLGPDGRVRSIFTLARDVTESKRSEEALRRSEADLRLLLDNIPAMVAYIDKEERFLRVNRTFEQWLNLPADQVVGRKVSDVLSVNYARIKDHIAHALKGEPARFEATNIYAGQERHMLVTYTPNFDEHNDVCGIVGLAADITDRKVMEEAIRDSDHRIRTITEAVPAILFSHLPDGRWDYVSHRFLEYTGLTLDETLGWGAVIHPDDADRVAAKWKEVIATCSRSVIEFRLRRYDGKYRWFRSWIVPTKDEQGNVSHWYGTCLDIEEQKIAEKALLDAEKLALVGRMAASISHEINNPLESVTNLLYLVSNDSGISDEARKYIDLAQQELSRVAQIATQTLRFNRSSSRKTKVDLSSIIDSALVLLAGRIRAAGITVVSDYRATCPLCCFEGEIRQVIANLIGNAVDAMLQGGQLHIRTHDCCHRGNGKNGIRVVISDSGSGMPLITRLHLFEPFYTTKENTGTGLGLWVTNEIVNKHGGTIRVRSSQDKRKQGTTFSLYFPHARD